jgi:GntR family transcriptional regulator / MocR family aminotransferase
MGGGDGGSMTQPTARPARSGMTQAQPGSVPGSIAVEAFRLDPDLSGTLQQRIRQMVASSILAGQALPGEKMPSSRGMAAHLGVSRITVTLAYAELVADDYLRAEGRSGYFVSDLAPQPIELAPQPGGGTGPDWAHLLAQGSTPGNLNSGKPRNWRDYRYPFVFGQADPTLFDHANWRHCMLQAMGQRDFARMTDDQFEQDDPDLVNYIARHSLPRRGIRARPDEILVTLGAQNALWLVAQLLLDRRRCAAIEEPGYPGLRAILGHTGCRLHHVPVGLQGLDPAMLPGGIDLLFCTPSHQSPTGATLPLPMRKALLDLAEARDFVIVEDDYEFEVAQGRAPLPSLKALDRAGRVLHVGSFSKSLFPGLRLGYLVGPAPLIREARALRAIVLRHPPGLLQRAAAQFLSLGHYDALVRRLTRAFAARRAVMLREIRAHGLTIAGAAEGGGSSFWMQTPDGVGAGALARVLRADGVLIEDGGAFFGLPGAPDRYFRIACSSIPADLIPEGIARIAARIGSQARKTG